MTIKLMLCHLYRTQKEGIGRKIFLEKREELNDISHKRGGVTIIYQLMGCISTR